MKLKQSDVLRYEKGRKSQATVRRHYKRWRITQVPPIPNRCDNPICIFHKHALEWNGKQLKLILDHINGVNGDNRVLNLQLLCPNCNSQQGTNGGANKGRVNQNLGGFSRVDSDGFKHHTLPVETLELHLTLNEVNFATSSIKP